jgi:hypothetical protein
MASETFGDVWRKVRLHAPGAPFGLVRDWTDSAYKTLCQRRPWGFTRVEIHLQTLASRTVTVTFTPGSRDITSAAGFVVATDPGRQIRVSTGLVYTLDTVPSTSAATLTLPWSGAAGAQTATLLDAYLTLPEDFGAFELVADTVNQRLIGWWYTQEDLGRLDPGRQSSDAGPRCLVSRGLSTRAATLGQPVYEWWPYPTGANVFPCFYRQKGLSPADTTRFQGVLSQRGDILETGALAQCAMWPGTAEQKNPYFNIKLAKTLKDDFERECARLELRDDDQAQQTWVAQPYHRWQMWDLFGDTDYLRSTDATLADYI